MLTGCRDPGAFCLLIEQRSKQLDTASSLFQFPIFSSYTSSLPPLCTYIFFLELKYLNAALTSRS
ncbi:hypothetical protein GHT06_012595 [Daphnia sinensis]|uniref:Uncharacterized protein n=1 Tax=Daphnia sinensis TaxID=1820382 RepID=A0AAD5LGL5_9CRUS|nr:hypothetical protein GHT06_012595 [Daphnia sinensis]